MSRLLHWPRFLLAAVLFTALAAPALAQQSELDAIARKAAEKILKRQKHVVVVFNFQVGKEAHHPLGGVAARDLISSFRRVAPNLELWDQASVTNHAPASSLLPEDMAWLGVAASLAGLQGVEVGVKGTLNLSHSGSKLKIELMDLNRAAPLSSDDFWENFGEFEKPVRMSPEWEALKDQTAEEVPSKFEKFLAKNGDSYPRCVHCPNPSFTDDARQNKIDGKVLILLTVNSVGDPENLFALAHPGHGLEQAALEAVRKWKFKPARHKDGKPFSMRVMIEVTFQLLPRNLS